MKELFKRLERYGHGWELRFIVASNNAVYMELSYYNAETKRVYDDKFKFSKDMFEQLHENDQYPINTLDHMHKRVTDDMRKPTGGRLKIDIL